MDRKKFIKKSITAAVAAALAPTLVSGKTEDKKLDQVGFNHLPNQEIKTKKTVLHKANTRGHANHGWLEVNHSFSFANYYNPERMSFGALRVLNDDKISPAKGFGRHPHNDMEIITIPLEGSLEHKDNMGNGAIIKNGDVQAMSAGTGVFHSEFNASNDSDVRLLQLWVFPKKKNVGPRYDQISIRDLRKDNSFYQVLSPNSNDNGVWIHQDAWFYMGEFEPGKEDTYIINKEGNGVYAFIIEGNVEIEGQALERRDGFGIWDTETIQFKSISKSKVLLIEVPMEVA